MARVYLGTLFSWTVPAELPDSCVWLRGQQELCPTTGRAHHQVIAQFNRAVRIPHVKRVIGDGHWEPTRSSAADAYVWKEDTRVPGTQFEFGSKAIRRNVSADWDEILRNAKTGNFEDIPSDIQV